MTTTSLAFLLLVLLAMLAAGMAVWIYSQLQQSLRWLTQPARPSPLDLQPAEVRAAMEELLSR